VKYVPKEHQLRRIDAAFTHHPPKGEDQIERYKTIRGSMKNLATFLAQSCPNSRELNSALKCLEEAQSWAIAAIARNE
jgi:hypothetical protein